MSENGERLLEQRARVWWALLVQPGDRVAGALVDELGPRRAAAVLNSDQDPRRIIRREGVREITPQELAGLRHRYPRRPAREQVAAVYRQLERHAIVTLEPGGTNWPSALDDLGPHKPFVLFAQGDLTLLAESKPRVAVVGTRKPSIEGARVATVVADGLSSNGYTTVSGGALGIDAIVHRCALRNHQPTIVVAATPLDRVYPREHRGLFEAVGSRGLLISETPPTATISPQSFLARNRIIAALSRDTVVIECPIQSGALNTASHVATLGRELWAVSYPVTTSTNGGFRLLIDEWGARELAATTLLGSTGLMLDNQGFLQRAV